MNLQQASQYLAISKKRLWRAVKSGQLEASRVQRGARWEYRVTEEELQTYRRKYLDSLEMRAVGWSEPERDVATPPVLAEVFDTTCTETERLTAELCEARLKICDLESRLKATELKRHESWQRMTVLARREQELIQAAGLLHKALGIMQVTSR